MERLRAEARAQAERQARELRSAREASAREKDEAVAAAVSSALARRTAELEATRSEAIAVLRAELEVTKATPGKFGRAVFPWEAKRGARRTIAERAATGDRRSPSMPAPARPLSRRRGEPINARVSLEGETAGRGSTIAAAPYT